MLNALRVNLIRQPQQTIALSSCSMWPKRSFHDMKVCYMQVLPSPTLAITVHRSSFMSPLSSPHERDYHEQSCEQPHAYPTGRDRIERYLCLYDLRRLSDRLSTGLRITQEVRFPETAALRSLSGPLLLVVRPEVSRSLFQCQSSGGQVANGLDLYHDFGF